MELDWAFMKEQVPLFVKGAVVTFEIAGMAILGSLLVALLTNTIYFFKIKWLAVPARIYVEVARNTPLLIQLFFLYFALPSVGIKISGYTTAVIGMIFLGGGYMTEVVRAGIEAVAKGQLESGLAIGLSRWQLLRHVILPQAVNISAPALFANFIFLLKETSVVSAVAVPELLYTTTSLISLYYKTYEMLLMLTGSYLLLFLPLSFLLSWMERRFKHGQFGA